MVWVLGFTYEVVLDSWKDARFADAFEQAWLAAGRPDDVSAWWCASADEYAFRWWLNEPATRLLDAAHVAWRDYVIGVTDVPPPQARRLQTEITLETSPSASR